MSSPDRKMQAELNSFKKVYEALHNTFPAFTFAQFNALDLDLRIVSALEHRQLIVRTNEELEFLKEMRYDDLELLKKAEGASISDILKFREIRAADKAAKAEKKALASRGLQLGLTDWQVYNTSYTFQHIEYIEKTLGGKQDVQRAQELYRVIQPFEDEHFKMLQNGYPLEQLQGLCNRGAILLAIGVAKQTIVKHGAPFIWESKNRKNFIDSVINRLMLDEVDIKIYRNVIAQMENPYRAALNVSDHLFEKKLLADLESTYLKQVDALIAEVMSGLDTNKTTTGGSAGMTAVSANGSQNSAAVAGMPPAQQKLDILQQLQLAKERMLAGRLSQIQPKTIMSKTENDAKVSVEQNATTRKPVEKIPNTSTSGSGGSAAVNPLPERWTHFKGNVEKFLKGDCIEEDVVYKIKNRIRYSDEKSVFSYVILTRMRVASKETESMISLSLVFKGEKPSCFYEEGPKNITEVMGAYGRPCPNVIYSEEIQEELKSLNEWYKSSCKLIGPTVVLSALEKDQYNNFLNELIKCSILTKEETDFIRRYCPCKEPSFALKKCIAEMDEAFSKKEYDKAILVATKAHADTREGNYKRDLTYPRSMISQTYNKNSPYFKIEGYDNCEVAITLAQAFSRKGLYGYEIQALEIITISSPRFLEIQKSIAAILLNPTSRSQITEESIRGYQERLIKKLFMMSPLLLNKERELRKNFVTILQLHARYKQEAVNPDASKPDFSSALTYPSIDLLLFIIENLYEMKKKKASTDLNVGGSAGNPAVVFAYPQPSFATVANSSSAMASLMPGHGERSAM